MKTKKFKLSNVNSNNIKGGRNNTRTILTAAGVISYGAAAGIIGYSVGRDNVDSTVDDGEGIDEKLEEPAEFNNNPQPETMSSQQDVQYTQSQIDDDITEPQPTDTSQSQESTNYNDGYGSTENKPEEVNPDLIAQQIIEEQNIDPYDIDSPTIVSVDELATLYRTDGSEMLVASVHTIDGVQYLLADIDGDGYFTDVFDMTGNYIGEAEGSLMASDLEIMVDDTGGYIAQNGDEPIGEEFTNDIINTANPINDDIAGNSVATSVSFSDSISDEDLLAQLLEDDGGEDEYLIDDGVEDLDDSENDISDDEYDVDSDEIFDA